MISTLRVNNGSFANLGSVVSQAVSTVANTVRTQTAVPQGTLTPAVTPVHQTPIPISVIANATGTVTVIHQPTLVAVASAFGTTRKVIPLHLGPSTPIVPAYNLGVVPAQTYDPRTTQGFASTTTQFQPYEQLTGIAHERPEVVMLTGFVPLFDRDVSHTAPDYIDQVAASGVGSFMTAAGKYIDAQINMRNIQASNSMSLVRTLRLGYPNVARQLKQRTSDFNQGLTKLQANAAFLLNLVRIVEAQKKQLDLRHDLYTVNPTEVATFISNNFTQQQVGSSATTRTKPTSSAQRKVIPFSLHPQSYALVDTLIAQGYAPDNVQNVFSSSKIWLQLLVELSNALKTHTLELVDIDPLLQRQDANATTLLNPSTVKRFGLSPSLSSLTIPNLEELVGLQVAGVSQAVSSIQTAFQALYQSVSFKNDEARIVALAHLLSQEYRFSYGLSQINIVNLLRNQYGFNPASNGNTTLFDAVFGQFGNNITDFSTANAKSLAGVAQQQITAQDVPKGVLTFEAKYVEGDTGTLTPGGDYFFDRLLNPDFTVPTQPKFNTAAIDALSQQLGDAMGSFSVLTDGMNLLEQQALLDNGQVDVRSSELTSTNNVLNFTKQLVDVDGSTLQPVLNDRMGAVYTQARTDNRVKTLLFLYTMARISRSYTTNVLGVAAPQVADNTPLVDALISQLVTALEASVPATRTAIQYTVLGVDLGLNTDALTSDSIKKAMKDGTYLTNFIEGFVSLVIAHFQVDTSAINAKFTRYSGMLDTVLMMVAFDYAVALIARYSNQKLTGVHTGLKTFSQGGPITFVVSRLTTNNKNSINELSQRAQGETLRVQAMVLAITNALKVLDGSLKGISNFMKSPATLAQLKDVATVLGNNRDALRMLLSEQQIMMLAAIAHDLIVANSDKTGAVQTAPVGQGDPTTDELKILDESSISAAMRNALYGFFGSGRFAKPAASNLKILTVGIPLGFTQRLKQKVSIQKQQRASFETHRNDIVNVCVYKIDMQNPDIVYKPQTMLFELSRFPVRITTTQWLPLTTNPTQQDVVSSVPTQNFSQNPDSGTANSITDGVEYTSLASAVQAGLRSARVAFDDRSYSFLNDAARTQILQNHVTSQMLETYIKLMTGLNVAEYSYDMVEVPPPVEDDFVSTLTEHTMAHMASVVSTARATNVTNSTATTGGVLFSSTAPKRAAVVPGSLAPSAVAQPQLTHPSGIAGNVTQAAQFRALTTQTAPVQTTEQQAVAGQLNANLSTLGAAHVSTAIAKLQTISKLGSTVSSLSNADAVNKRVLSPKQFDRVFNLVIDPGSFEIDVIATTATPYGRDALQLMLQHGEIVPIDENDAYAQHVDIVGPAPSGFRGLTAGTLPANINGYQLRERDRNAGDLVFDKYLVTVETFGKDEV